MREALSATVRFRSSRIDDADSLCEVQRRAIDSSRHYTDAQRRAWMASVSPAYVAQTLGQCLGLVCETRHGIAGFAQLDVEGGRITALYVEPACTSRGIGGALLHEIALLAARAGRVALTLQSSLDAVSFYRRRGFVILKRRVLEVPDVQAFQVFEMHRPLVPEELTWKSEEVPAATTTTTTGASRFSS
jgi:GNAT superfamily N-acetyltransferase